MIEDDSQLSQIDMLTNIKIVNVNEMMLKGTFSNDKNSKINH